MREYYQFTITNIIVFKKPNLDLNIKFHINKTILCFFAGFEKGIRLPVKSERHKLARFGSYFQ